MSKIFLSIFVGLILGLGFSLFYIGIDAIGNSRVRDYYKYYGGSMSYSGFKISFRPNLVGASATSDLWFPVLHYGYNLETNKIVNADIIESEIPKQEIEYIFYDTSWVKNFSHDSIYVAKVGLRGNYFFHPFKSKYGFEIIEYIAYSANNFEAEKIIPQPDWNHDLMIYALVCLSLIFLFFISFCSIMVNDEDKNGMVLMPVFFIGLYSYAVFYIDSYDYEYIGFSYLKPIFIALLVGMYIWYVYLKSDKALDNKPADEQTKIDLEASDTDPANPKI